MQWPGPGWMHSGWLCTKLLSSRRSEEGATCLWSSVAETCTSILSSFWFPGSENEIWTNAVWPHTLKPGQGFLWAYCPPYSLQALDFNIWDKFNIEPWTFNSMQRDTFKMCTTQGFWWLRCSPLWLPALWDNNKGAYDLLHWRVEVHISGYCMVGRRKWVGTAFYMLQQRKSLLSGPSKDDGMGETKGEDL